MTFYYYYIMQKIFFTAILLVIVVSQKVPVFPNQYEVAFNETSSIGPLSGTTKGKIYLDATKNVQLVTRENGQHDRYCGTVYKFVNTPCNHYVTNNKRFLDFPQKKYCCFCCDSAHGCGITSPDWLVKSNATFKGYEKVGSDSEASLKWYIKGNLPNILGLQDNYYYHKNDTALTPRRLVQASDDTMDFSDFYIGIKD